MASISNTAEFRPMWIVGAGLAGALLATLLAKRGFTVTISEKRSSVELEQLAAGRSINLALAERAGAGHCNAGASSAFERRH